MNVNELVLLTVLLVAATLMAVGAYMIYSPSGFIVGGLLLAVIGVLYLVDDGRSNEARPPSRRPTRG